MVSEGSPNCLSTFLSEFNADAAARKLVLVSAVPKLNVERHMRPPD